MKKLRRNPDFTELRFVTFSNAHAQLENRHGPLSLINTGTGSKLNKRKAPLLLEKPGHIHSIGTTHKRLQKREVNLVNRKNVMSAATPLDKEINQYLLLLSDRQKEAVLTVVKTFAENAAPYYDDAFKQELDDRFEDYKNGGVLVSEAEAQNRIKQIITGKAKK